MVAREILDLFVKVRVLARQPLPDAPMSEMAVICDRNATLTALRHGICCISKDSMIHRSTATKWLIAGLAALVIEVPCFLSAASFEWNMQRIEGRDYLPLARVAEFYTMDGAEDASYFTLLRGDAGEIEAAVDSRQVLINGVRHWLGFPVIERNEIPLISRIDFVKTIEPALRPQRIRNLAKFDTVVIDPGHGGHDHGAVGKTVDEKR